MSKLINELWHNLLAIIGFLTAAFGIVNSLFGWFNSIIDFIKKFLPPGYDVTIRYAVIGLGICLLITAFCNRIIRSEKRYLEGDEIPFRYTPQQIKKAERIRWIFWVLYLTAGVATFWFERKSCLRNGPIAGIVITRFSEDNNTFSKDLYDYLSDTLKSLEIKDIKAKPVNVYFENEPSAKERRRSYECFKQGVFTWGNSDFPQESFTCYIHTDNLKTIYTERYKIRYSDHIWFQGSYIAAQKVGQFILGLVMYFKGDNYPSLDILKDLTSAGIGNSEFAAYCYLFTSYNHIQLKHKDSAKANLEMAKSFGIKKKELQTDIDEAGKVITQMPSDITTVQPQSDNLPDTWGVKPDQEMRYTPKEGKFISIMNVEKIKKDAPVLNIIFYIQEGSYIKIEVMKDREKIFSESDIMLNKLESIMYEGSNDRFPTYNIPVKNFALGKYSVIVMANNQADTLNFEIIKK